MKHILPPLLMAATLTSCAAGASTQAPAAPREGRFTWESYAGEAGTRRYRLYLPASHDGSPAPLVVMLHGCTQDPDDFAAGTRMNALAEEHGFLVAYPEQTAEGHPQKCWSWFDPAHQERGGGEPALIAGITREVMNRHPVDPARVYVAGVSAGGAMALVMAAAYPELYAAAGVHSAVPYRAAGSVREALEVMKKGGGSAADMHAAALRAMGTRARPLPVIAFHGGADEVVAERNLDDVVHQWVSVSEAAGAPLRIADDVREEPDPADPYGARRVVFRDREGRTVVEAWRVPALGHAWSGGSPEGTFTDPRGPDASREIVRFFLEHPAAP